VKLQSSKTKIHQRISIMFGKWNICSTLSSVGAVGHPGAIVGAATGCGFGQAFLVKDKKYAHHYTHQQRLMKLDEALASKPNGNQKLDEALVSKPNGNQGSELKRLPIFVRMTGERPQDEEEEPWVSNHIQVSESVANPIQQNTALEGMSIIATNSANTAAKGQLVSQTQPMNLNATVFTPSQGMGQQSSAFIMSTNSKAFVPPLQSQKLHVENRHLNDDERMRMLLRTQFRSAEPLAGQRPSTREEQQQKYNQDQRSLAVQTQQPSRKQRKQTAKQFMEGFEFAADEILDQGTKECYPYGFWVTKVPASMKKNFEADILHKIFTHDFKMGVFFGGGQKKGNCVQVGFKSLDAAVKAKLDFRTAIQTKFCQSGMSVTTTNPIPKVSTGSRRK
jgi:hypothetical protein